MLMKNGNDVPLVLADELAKDAHTLQCFENMRPSFQKQLALSVTTGKKPETNQRRAANAVSRIIKCGEWHGNKNNHGCYMSLKNRQMKGDTPTE